MLKNIEHHEIVIRFAQSYFTVKDIIKHNSRIRRPIPGQCLAIEIATIDMPSEPRLKLALDNAGTAADIQTALARLGQQAIITQQHPEGFKPPANPKMCLGAEIVPFRRKWGRLGLRQNLELVYSNRTLGNRATLLARS